jgi:ribose transport system ATP-binding protein
MTAMQEAAAHLGAAHGSGMGGQETVLSASGVTKRFPGVVALDGASLGLRRGEVHALCGENGAGKSTFMKILGGVQPPDAGQIVYKGRPCRFASTLQAQAAGIAIIHQELNLVPHLSVAENLFLAREPRKGPFVDTRRMRADTRVLLDRLRLAVEPDASVRSLSVAQQQMVEIAKALSVQAEVLIMDEPTSSLTAHEATRLFEIINELKSEGVAIVYVSHRLDEFRHIVDRVTVLRDGKTISTVRFADTTIERIVADMVGRELADTFPAPTRAPDGTCLLRVEGLARRGAFGPLGFELRRGEILGFAGLMGAGRTEVARAIFGADPADSGTIELKGQAITVRSPIDAIGHGIAYLSEDRKGEGLAVRMPVAANITLANMDAVAGRFGFIDFAAEEAVAQRYIAALGIKTPSPAQVAQHLSGGNQQKVAIGKWLFRDSKIIFFDEPTRGIDVGARFAIYQLLDRLAADGIGVVLISSDLPEIMGMTDRVAVFREGRISGVVDTARSSQEEIMQLASTNKTRR